MIDIDCVAARELLPDFVSSRATNAELAAVDAHVARCSECAAELELVQLLFGSRPRAPLGLAQRVVRAVRSDRTVVHNTWWGLTAAAIGALALGIGLSSEPSSPAPDVPGYAYEMDEDGLWLSDDGLVAGAPLFTDLSDDELMRLLEELIEESPGGSV